MSDQQELRQCEACGITANDLVERDGMYFCPSLARCDYNANIGWLNADIQAGIDAAEQQLRHER